MSCYNVKNVNDITNFTHMKRLTKHHNVHIFSFGKENQPICWLYLEDLFLGF